MKFNCSKRHQALIRETLLASCVLHLVLTKCQSDPIAKEIHERQVGKWLDHKIKYELKRNC